jgi:hypothetical protein
VDVAQRDDGALAGRQVAQAGQQDRQRLAGQHHGLRVPGARRALSGPAARPLLAGRAEAAGIDRRPVVAVGEGAEDHPPVALAAAAGDVGHDRHRPRAQLRATLEALEAADHSQPRLLHALLGGGAGPDERAGHPQHERRPVADHRGERRLLAGAQSRQQLRIGVGLHRAHATRRWMNEE